MNDGKEWTRMDDIFYRFEHYNLAFVQLAVKEGQNKDLGPVLKKKFPSRGPDERDRIARERLAQELSRAQGGL